MPRPGTEVASTITSYSELLAHVVAWKDQLVQHKHDPPAPDRTWYAYDILSNFWHLEHLMKQLPSDWLDRFKSGHVADIGAADGDLSYFLESMGLTVDLIDCPATNWNGLEGARALHDRLKSRNVGIHEVNLDTQFKLPSPRYDLVFFLGILYHLKNPFYVLETLARHSRYCFLSTRIARRSADGKVKLERAPVAYLLSPEECNNDPTNYWIFSAPGLIRLAERCGWTVKATYRAGDTKRSNPSSDKHDERMFLALKSNLA